MTKDGYLFPKKRMAFGLFLLACFNFSGSLAYADGSGGGRAGGGAGMVSGGGTTNPVSVSERSQGAPDKFSAAVSIMRFALEVTSKPATAAETIRFASSIGPIGLLTGAQIGQDTGGGDPCPGNQIHCNRWLQEQHKRILLRLMTAYYALGTGQKANTPQQAELIAKLVANVISSK